MTGGEVVGRIGLLSGELYSVAAGLFLKAVLAFLSLRTLWKLWELRKLLWRC